MVPDRPRSARLLSEIYKHSRDSRIEFRESDHTYILDDVYVFPRSVSRLVAESFDEFDAPRVAKKCLPKWRKDPTSKYHSLIEACEAEIPGCRPDVLICAAWGANGAYQSELGRMMHLTIEMTLNGLSPPDSEPLEPVELDTNYAPRTLEALCSPEGTKLRIEEAKAIVKLAKDGHFSTSSSDLPKVKVSIPPAAMDSPEILAWKKWKDTLGVDFAPLRTEWSVFSIKHQIAGQIDALFKRSSTGDIVLVDWKRVAGLERSPRFSEGGTLGPCGLAPLGDIPDTKYWHYAIQVNVYAYILSEFYKIQVSEMYLVQIHPSLPSPGFKQHRIDFIAKDTIEALLTRPFRDRTGTVRQL